MNSFYQTIFISFLGAMLALSGAYLMYKKQTNSKIKNIKSILVIELEDIHCNIEKNLVQLNSENKNGSIQLMVNKVYYTPSNYDALRPELSLLNETQISNIIKLYRKIKELEEVRDYLVKIKEEDINLTDIEIKNELTPKEGIIKKKMDIYANYFLNLDLLLEQIEEAKESIK